MKLIFLDRDGVINKDPGFGYYITCWEEFKFLSGALLALKKLNEAGFSVIIISNQAGVSKGLYTRQGLDQFTDKMLKKVEEAGGKIQAVHYCPHQDSDNCNCRKPKTGLFLQATEGLKINFADTFYVGDTKRDVLAAKGIGAKSIFVQSGNANRKEIDIKPDFTAKNLLEAVEKIILK